jgi:RimJ/RimL family protein N-acetyltransferase
VPFDPAQFPVSRLDGARLVLEPLTVDHSDEMAPLLDDPLLHAFTGGEPVSAEDLRARYARQSVGWSKDRDERWLNWIVRRCDDGQVVGYVQATVTLVDSRSSADVAWVIGSKYQRRGYAKEAAGLMVDWLRGQGVRTVSAHIRPDHQASQAVASQLGLHPTTHLVDGEIRWEDSPLPSDGR